MTRKLNVLLVDDNKHFLKAMRFLLETSCCDILDSIFIANDGIECLDILNKQQIDVIFMDIEMPRMNGIDATRMVTSEFRDIKVIAVSFHSDEQYLINIIEAGAKNFISKSKINKEKIREVLVKFD
ncbi:MAG: response regulator [bacterium]